MPQIAASTVVLASPWRSALVVSADAGHPRAGLSSWTFGPAVKQAAEHLGPVPTAMSTGPCGGICCREDGTLRSGSRIEQDLLARDKYADAR
jgi:hypothetical protein